MYSHENISPKVHPAILKGQWAIKYDVSKHRQDRWPGACEIPKSAPVCFLKTKRKKNHWGKTRLLTLCLKDIHSQDKEILSHQLGFEMLGIDHDLLDIQRYRNGKKSTLQVSPLEKKSSIFYCTHNFAFFQNGIWLESCDQIGIFH